MDQPLLDRVGYKPSIFFLPLQVTLEDAGTITLQVGSCSSEAQLKVTGGHPYPTAASPGGRPLSPSTAAAAEVLEAQDF